MPSIEPLSADVHGWLAEQLEVAATASPTEVRTALLHRLPDEDFVPPLPWRYAVDLHAGRCEDKTALVSRNLIRWELEEKLRGELNEFTEVFFKIAPTDRRRRWDHLQERCAHLPSLSDRLKRLDAGIDVIIVKDADPDMSCLIEHICELFVLPPPAAAARRQSILHESLGDEAKWAATARQLQKCLPKLAALEPELIQKTLAWKKRVKKRKRAASILQLSEGKIIPLTFTVVILVCLGLTFWYILIVQEKSRVEAEKRHAYLAPFLAHLPEFTVQPLGKDIQPPYRRGKLIPINVTTNHQIDGIIFDFPDALRADRPDDVGTIVWLEWGTTKVGTYVLDRCDAVVITCKVTLIDKSKRLIICEQEFTGGPPPEPRKTNQPNHGSSPTYAILAWLLKLPLR